MSAAEDIAALRERDGDACHLCAQPIDFTLTWPHGFCATRDHIVPRSVGGLNVLSNYRLAHKRCNSGRGSDFHPGEAQFLECPDCLQTIPQDYAAVHARMCPHSRHACLFCDATFWNAARLAAHQARGACRSAFPDWSANPRKAARMGDRREVAS